MIEPPRTPSGRVAWKKLCQGKKPGDTIELPRRYARSAQPKINLCGIPCTSTVIGTEGVLITILEAPVERTKTLDSHLIREAELRDRNLPRRIKEARENATYWQRQIYLREHPQAIEQAKANHAAWKMTASRLQAQLETQTATA